MEVELPFSERILDSSEPVCIRIRWKVPQQLHASPICCFIRVQSPELGTNEEQAEMGGNRGTPSE